MIAVRNNLSIVCMINYEKIIYFDFDSNIPLNDNLMPNVLPLD
jgi:hypothetical protein